MHYACTTVACHKSNADKETTAQCQDPLGCVLIRKGTEYRTTNSGGSIQGAPLMEDRFGDGLGGAES